MNLTPSKMEVVQMKFDSYVKKCCKNELRNIEKYNKRIQKREILVANHLIQSKDEYSAEMNIPDFVVKGYEIVISDKVLLDALEKLESRERELVLLIFFIGYKPKEVSEELGVVERTIYNRQDKILEKSKKIMEGKND